MSDTDSLAKRTYLLCSTPVHGHFSPLATIGQHLVSRGHRVLMLTGSRFALAVTDRGMEFRALDGLADFDDRKADSFLPDRDNYRGLARAQYDIQSIFVHTIPAQFRAVERILAAESVDAIVVDNAFAGVAPLLQSTAGSRVPVLAVGVTPLSQSSRDVAPYGTGMLPLSGPLGHLRNHVLNFVAHRVLFRDTQRAGQRAFAELGQAPLDHFIMDISSAFDRFLQLNARSFEYPRSDLAANTTFVGPVIPTGSDAVLPEWWGDLADAQHVVHVTQGTIDNLDLGKLIVPTIAALANTDVLVVVSTGGRDATALGALPLNVRVAEYLPYDRLLPLTDVFVTNGGFGGVQQALSYGVPIVIAGDTEDKPEVAARVQWSGVGVNLRTGTPTPGAVATAVRAVLDDDSYRSRARSQADAIAALDSLTAIELELQLATAGFRASS
jgi:MGT family glycosyltransferase